MADNRTPGPTTLRVKELLEINPTQTLASIAKQVGVTRERVRQIIQREHLTRSRPPPVDHGACVDCGKRFPRPHKKNTRKKNTRKKDTCNPCSVKRNTLTLICSVCDKPFTRRREHNRSKSRVFCSKVCQGAWLGTTHGPKKTLDRIAVESLLNGATVMLTSECQWAEESSCRHHGTLRRVTKRTGRRFTGRHTDLGFVATRIA